MVQDDYDEIYSLWQSIGGFGIRSIDDSKPFIQRFIERNPNTNIVAVHENRIVGAILCGHDGRRGCFYHVCVHEDYRLKGIGKMMVAEALEALKAEQINKVNLVAFRKNSAGNAFWKDMGWTLRDEINYYEYDLNKENVTYFNPDK